MAANIASMSGFFCGVGICLDIWVSSVVVGIASMSRFLQWGCTLPQCLGFFRGGGHSECFGLFNFLSSGLGALWVK